MHYLEDDIAYLVNRSPYLQLAKPKSAARILNAELLAGEECRELLGRYPQELYEPLEFFYTCLHALGALNVDVLEDLLASTWRGVVWGCYLVFIDTQREYLDVLRKLNMDLPHSQWLVDLVIAEGNFQGAGPDIPEAADAMRRLKSCLLPLRRPNIKLRRAPDAVEHAHLSRERAYIAHLYRSSGTHAALGAVPGTLLSYYLQDYRQWCRAGCKPPPPLSACPVPSYE